METVFLLLGGNIGEREKTISNAITFINTDVGTVVRASSFYETEPWGMLNAQNFLNIALQLSTSLTAFELLDALLKIEKRLGRERNQLSVAYESRPVDIDILFYGQSVINDSRLVIPHPRLQERRFVLVPLSEIAGEFIHPVFQKSIASLLNECRDQLKTEVLKPYHLL